MTNGAKVYVCGLESDPITEVESDLNELGKASGGSAIGYIIASHLVPLQRSGHQKHSVET